MTDSIWHDIILVIPSTLMGLAAFVSSLRNRKKIEEVHKTINGGLSVQLTNAKDAGNLEGRTELRQENRGDDKERKEKKL